MSVTMKLFGALFFTTGLMLLCFAITMGIQVRPPAMIFYMSCGSILVYISWRMHHWPDMTLGRFYILLFKTFIIHLILLGLLYFIGIGIGSLFGANNSPTTVANSELYLIIGLIAIGCVSGIVFGFLQERVAAEARIQETEAKLNDPKTPDILVSETAVTPQSLFRRIHSSHIKQISKKQQDDRPNEKSAGAETKIKEAESRLGITLPDGLRELYLVQNGGYVGSVCILQEEAQFPFKYGDFYCPFGEHEVLYPLEMLETAWEKFTEFGDPGDQEGYGHLFSNGTEKMIVIAQWSLETLFLDYREPGTPRVGFVDFYHEDWPKRVDYWSNFESFFAALRRYENTE